MALPLPKVVPDVGPGGGIVTALGGINSLANDMLLRKINQVKAKYAPWAEEANVKSKNAYADLVGLQPAVKILANENAFLSLPDWQQNAIKQAFLKSGGRLAGFQGNNGNGNSLNGMPSAGPIPQTTGSGQPHTNSFSRNVVDAFKNALGIGNRNPQLNNTLNAIAHVESRGTQNPYSLIGSDTGKGDRALGKYQVMASNVPSWTKEALGQSMTPQEFLNSPEAQEKVAAFRINNQLNQGVSPDDVGSTCSQASL